ncbi:hypothetical protein PHYPSEUDO_002063 [Phytophthora pseudosyringae]|uniref:Uncharacterized protein n=1 Tax=Phytophthora pseudosyringae TaxID=221518 RepID=A0A8T1V4R9_9STRA|nr:hypothetical protein PHYPSEUDO_002063 [Phytophthora pseudosyringae]
MTPSMMATRNALPLSTPATLQYIREKTTTADAETTASADGASSKPRDSTGARFSRKMKELLPSKKEQPQDATEEPARKSAFYRQFVAARAFTNTGIRR